MEHGTPYKDAFGVVMGAADKFEYNASIAQALMGAHIPMESGKVSYFKREPFGVAAIIIPWNLPVIMTAVKNVRRYRHRQHMRFKAAQYQLHDDFEIC